MDRVSAFCELHYPSCLKSVTTYQDIIKNKDILDIGSNIGLFAKAVAETTSYKSIHLFEPSIDLFEKSKAILNNFQNIHYNNVGIGDSNCTGTLYKDPGSNIGWNTILTKDPNQQNGFHNYLTPEQITVVKLDDYYKDIDNIDFIKIDVEGYERHVIEGSFNLIKKFKPFLFVEVGWGMRHPEWHLNNLTYNKLFDIGYEYVDFHPTDTQDILFIPKR